MSGSNKEGDVYDKIAPFVWLALFGALIAAVFMYAPPPGKPCKCGQCKCEEK